MKLHKLINRQQKKNKKYKKKAKRPFRLKIHKVKKKQLLMMNYEVVSLTEIITFFTLIVQTFKNLDGQRLTIPRAQSAGPKFYP